MVISMDTSIFQYVLTVAECGSISAAARKLFMSQPALTKHISKLEKELGVQLFNRSRTPLTLTAAGAVFLEYAGRYVEQERECRERLKKVAGLGQEQILVATTHRGGSYVGDRTASFLTRYPNLSLEYLDASAEKCEEALKSGEVDLAVYTDPVMSDQIEYMPLEEDRLIFVMSSEYPLLQGMDLSSNSLDCLLELEPEQLQNPDITWLLSTKNHSLYFAECNFFHKYKIAPVHSLRVDYVDTRYSIACGGGGIVLVPTSTARRNAGNKKVVYCTLKGNGLYRYVIIAKKKGYTLPQGAEAFWRFMIEQRFQSPRQDV